MSYSYGGWEDEFQGLTKETNFAGSANKSLGAKPVKDTSGGNNNDDDGGQDATASSIFKNIAKSVVDNTDVSVEEALNILTPEHNTSVKPSGLNTSRKHNTYYKNLEANRATQFEFLQGYIDSNINETVFKPMGKKYSSSSVGLFTEITERRHPGQNISLTDTSSGKKVTSGGLMDILKENMSYDMLNKPYDYASTTPFTPAVEPVIEEVAPEVYPTTRQGNLKDLGAAIKSTFREKRDATIERKVSEVGTGSELSKDGDMRFTSDFKYNREVPGLSTASVGFETNMGGAELSTNQGIKNVDKSLGLNVGGQSYAGYQYGLSSDMFDYGDTAQYTLTTPTVDGLTATTSFGADGTSVGIDKAGDAFLSGKYNFSIFADDDSNVNSSLTAGWEW